MIPSVLAAASDTDWAIITDLVVILVSAAVVAVVMQPMRLAAIPAYLIAGALVGPRALGLVKPMRWRMPSATSRWRLTKAGSDELTSV